MKKRLFVLIVSLTAMLGISAQSISESDARSKAMQFLTKGMAAKMRVKGIKNTDLKLAKCNSEKLYVFNVGSDEGFVVVSGDSRTRSILGYGTNGSFDLNKAPENLKAWLKSYEMGIKELEDKDFPTVTAAETEGGLYGPAIEPLLTTKWDQKEPYNLMCPEYNGKHCLTGCPATALSQVLYYWKAPQHWVLPIPGYHSDFYGAQIDLPELPHIKFDWDNMCDTYAETDVRTEEQKMAVAELMRYCGQAMESKYSPDASGAIQMEFVKAMQKYFGFAESTRDIFRHDYTIKEWESIVYDNLSRGIPVPYGGSTGTDGHVFVCDGYDGNGLFHINWGWGGKCDNYFSLSILNPRNNDGSGASASSLGYCAEQEMIINAVPSDHYIGEVPFLAASPKGTMTIDEDSVFISAINASSRDGVFELALALKDADGNLTPVIKSVEDGSDAFFIPSVKGWMWLWVYTDSGLKPGSYDLYPVSRCISVPDSAWAPIYKDRYIHLEVEESQASVKLMPAVNLSLADFKVSGNGYALENQGFLMTIRNNGELEHNDYIRAVVTYDKAEGKPEGTQNCTTYGYIPVDGTGNVELYFSPIMSGKASILLYSEQDPGQPFGTFEVEFKEPREEFLYAFSVPQYATYYSCSETDSVFVEMGLSVINNFEQTVTRDIYISISDGTNKARKYYKTWTLNSEDSVKGMATFRFSAEELEEANFDMTKLSEGITFELSGLLGNTLYPFFEVYIPFGDVVVKTNDSTGIKDITTPFHSDQRDALHAENAKPRLHLDSNGRIVIEKDGRVYNIIGGRVK